MPKWCDAYSSVSLTNRAALNNTRRPSRRGDSGFAHVFNATCANGRRVPPVVPHAPPPRLTARWLPDVVRALPLRYVPCRLPFLLQPSAPVSYTHLTLPTKRIV